MKSWKHIAFCFAGLSASFAMVSCDDDPVYPVEPVIAFESFVKIQNNGGPDNKGILKITFTDGDGDIGLTENDNAPPYDTASPYYYNCFVAYFEKQKGVFKEVALPISNNYRIPLTPPAEKGLPLIGEVDIELFINNYLSIYDTIRYEVYIVDRALHHSNTITTPEIIVKKH